MNGCSVGQKDRTDRQFWTGAATKERPCPWAALINVLPIGDCDCDGDGDGQMCPNALPSFFRRHHPHFPREPRVTLSRQKLIDKLCATILWGGDGSGFGWFSGWMGGWVAQWH